ncbi:uncharacterized protein EI97DRAFT_130170 [Westerdykella ornata]|uniref:Uncharacterized protein n=1 Tax=Westerdykella ornata TaxID=318751 RepID=A0A6A6JD33_WESOR|nr:uncharacterized protein EI97DRAFT_130170 [Westerdykella ornata]KAF2274177.1 hypothetical protein EI97DRAFT_130170 [Westerdykella ornata]
MNSSQPPATTDRPHRLLQYAGLAKNTFQVDSVVNCSFVVEGRTAQTATPEATRLRDSTPSQPTNHPTLQQFETRTQQARAVETLRWDVTACDRGFGKISFDLRAASQSSTRSYSPRRPSQLLENINPVRSPLRANARRRRAGSGRREAVVVQGATLCIITQRISSTDHRPFAFITNAPKSRDTSPTS